MPTLFFNSHPHKEDDGCWRRKRNSSEVFNSHPHKEDDLLPDHKYQHCDFSTHILTRRMTWFCKLFILCCAFSTHILTRRMTENCEWVCNIYGFSTHILTRRMTQVDAILFLMESFQLTSSQGG